MRILYGVQGTGNGHITRARVMLPALQALGCTVDFVFSGRARDAYFDMAPFGRYRCFKGFTFANHQGAVQWRQTLWQADVAAFYRDVQALNVRDYDLVLTDFEPVSAWAAKRQGVPAVGLAHQYALRHRIPGTARAPWLPLCLQTFAPAPVQLGVHWADFDAPILPPLIAASHHTATSDEGFVLVYLPFENPDFIRHWLKQLPQQRFVVYAAVRQTVTDKNLTIKPLNRTTFPLDLATCSGVVCNSGFGLCSEAMVLGKKILTRPQRRQIEQESNAQILQQLGRVTVMKQFDHEVLRPWLAQAAPPKAEFPDVAAAVAQWLVAGRHHDSHGLVADLWQQSRHVALADNAPAAVMQVGV